MRLTFINKGDTPSSVTTIGKKKKSIGKDMKNWNTCTTVGEIVKSYDDYEKQYEVSSEN